MSMLDRYLNAIAWQLPEATRADIVSELRDDILSRVEALEAAAGRPATDANMEAVLRATGHPATVAARYAGRGGLLPPEAVPWWWLQVAAIGALILIVNAAAAVQALIAGQPAMQAIGRAAWTGSKSFMFWVGLLTIVSILSARYFYPYLLSRWSPSQLPPVAPNTRPGKAALIIGLAVFSALLLWWAGVAELPGALGDLLPGPAWDRLYWPVLAVIVLVIVQLVVEIFQPARLRLAAALAAASSIATIAIAGYALRHGPLVMVAKGAAVSAASVGMLATVNAVGPIVLVIVVIAHLFQGWTKARAALRYG